MSKKTDAAPALCMEGWARTDGGGAATTCVAPSECRCCWYGDSPTAFTHEEPEANYVNEEKSSKLHVRAGGAGEGGLGANFCT